MTACGFANTATAIQTTELNNMIASRIAVQLKCLKQPNKKALHTAARLGCDGVQFNAIEWLGEARLSETGLREVRKLLDELNLRVASMALPSPRGLSDADGMQQRIERTVEAMRLTSRLGGRVLVVRLGPVPADEQSPAHATLVDVLSTLAVGANHLGVQLAAYAPEADPEQLATFVQSLPEGMLGVDLPPAAIIAQGRSPLEFVEMLGPHITHVHGSDAVHDLATGGAVEVELGHGSADYPELLGHLEEHGYRGWITLERYNSQQIEKDLANAVQYLRAI